MLPFHHGERIAELIEAAGCKVIYLPPDSPDLNCPSEMLGLVEKLNSHTVTRFVNLRDAIDTVLKQAASYYLWRQL